MILSEDTEEAIAQAFFDYKEKLKEIFKPFDDETLLAFSGKISNEEIDQSSQARHLVPRMTAFMEVRYRQISKEADKVFKADPNVKMVCGLHMQDTSKCGCFK